MAVSPLGNVIVAVAHAHAHAVKDSLGRAYNRTTHLPQWKKMMQRWADYLDQLRLQANSDNVVSLTNRQKLP